ncbi:hypothetical protein AMECASPLE_036980 [Ameca splendens]|uniref:Uncharacterized protein n=1 Tax=Ameca splendens TaxID=208324 RepID=A0ABV1AF32_9TELE
MEATVQGTSPQTVANRTTVKAYMEQLTAIRRAINLLENAKSFNPEMVVKKQVEPGEIMIITHSDSHGGKRRRGFGEYIGCSLDLSCFVDEPNHTEMAEDTVLLRMVRRVYGGGVLPKSTTISTVVSGLSLR